MRTTRSGFLKAAALGVVLSIGGYSAASAAFVPIDFTWDPSATGDTTAGAFTASGFGISDFATIRLPANPAPVGSIIETGFLVTNTFSFAGAKVSTVNQVGAGGYGMYESFTATSHGTGSGLNFTGTFDTITATTFLYSSAHGLARITFNGAHTPVISLPAGAHPVTLATASGPLPDAVVPNFANITSGVPGASVGTLFTPNAAQSGFFVSPSSSIILNLEQIFSNTIGAIRTSPRPCPSPGACVIEIGGTGFPGGGNGDFLRSIVPVPEPASLALLGVGLVSLGLVRRRRR